MNQTHRDNGDIVMKTLHKRPAGAGRPSVLHKARSDRTSGGEKLSVEILITLAQSAGRSRTQAGSGYQIDAALGSRLGRRGLESERKSAGKLIKMRVEI